MERDPIQGFPAPAKNRHEELQTLHVLTAGLTHGTVCPELDLLVRLAEALVANTDTLQGAFLPFHRYLMHAHEHLLKTECGYEGTQP